MAPDLGLPHAVYTCTVASVRAGCSKGVLPKSASVRHSWHPDILCPANSRPCLDDTRTV